MSIEKNCVRFEDVLPGTFVFETENSKIAAFIRSDTPAHETLWGGSMVWIMKNPKKGYSFRTLKGKYPVLGNSYKIRFISGRLIIAYLDGRFVRHITTRNMDKRQAGRAFKKFKRENNL